MKSYHVDENGYYGRFGGAYIPEILYKTVEDLKKAYLPIIESDEFQTEFRTLLRDYVGRPSPLYYAKRMSENTVASYISSVKTSIIQVHTR